MQQQHVQITIRPLVCDLLTTRRALQRLEAQSRATDHSLTKRLKRVIEHAFNKACEDPASLFVKGQAAWSIRSLESNATGPIRLTLELTVPKDLPREQIVLLRSLYHKFKEGCQTIFLKVEKLTLQFEEI